MRRDYAEICGTVKSKSTASRDNLLHFAVNTTKELDVDSYEITTNTRHRATDSGREVDKRARRASTRTPRRDEMSRVAARPAMSEVNLEISRDSEIGPIKRERECHVECRAYTVFHYYYNHYYYSIDALRARTPIHINRRSLDATHAHRFLVNSLSFCELRANVFLFPNYYCYHS